MTTKTKNVEMIRANELMRAYAQALENKKAKMAEIKNELDAYDNTMKDAEAELVVFGEQNEHLFDRDDNLHFDDGYLHISSQTVVETTKKFSWPDFMEQKGDLVKIDFEKAKLKKAWLDTDQHNELIGLGVQINTDRVMQVKVAKKNS